MFNAVFLCFMSDQNKMDNIKKIVLKIFETISKEEKIVHYMLIRKMISLRKKLSMALWFFEPWCNIQH